MTAPRTHINKSDWTEIWEDFHNHKHNSITDNIAALNIMSRCAVCDKDFISGQYNEGISQEEIDSIKNEHQGEMICGDYVCRTCYIEKLELGMFPPVQKMPLDLQF